MIVGESTTGGDGRRLKAGRSRDAAASKHALLLAAQQLFGRNGFEGTTIRDIGERAGVDAALIARYFGSKADLYIAAVAEEDQGGRQPREYNGLRPMADELVTRADARGPGAIVQALARSDTSDEIREAAKNRLARRLVDPLVASMNEQQVGRAQLRAEIAVSALVGIALGRSLGWFEELRSAPKDDLVALIAETLGVALAEDPAGPSGPTGPGATEGQGTSPVTSSPANILATRAESK
jgi:AcrR family transcriptional regulator